MDATKWFHLVGLISAVALGIGFVTALVSVGLSWRVNETQKTELARLSHDKDVQIAKARTDGETRLGIETAKVRQDAQTKIEIETAKVRAEADEKIEQVRADAQKDAATARVRQDEIALELRTSNKELASAQRAADIARLDLQKHLNEVAERQRFRQLTPVQRAGLLERLSVAPKGAATVSYVSSNPESNSFAVELYGVLKEAGWSVALGASQHLGENPKGLLLWERATTPRGAGLIQALTAVGVPVLAQPNDTLSVGINDLNSLWLVVGVKP
ncbi:MAG: hypothetical protein JWM21_1061 [Acidobacteria bacterium]|nr:hypothetical protein [Acidobacteriota bacterium]